MTIKRDRYLNRLIERRHNGFVKIITGIRRCGKSFLLFRLFREHLIRDGVRPSQIVEIALDMKKFSDLKDPLALGDYIDGKIKGRGWHYVFIDETLECGRALPPVVNVGTRKIYVQSAFSIPDEAKRRQETESLRRSGDFFKKIVVVSGFKPPQQDESGIIFVGVIPFLLDQTLLEV